MTAAPPGADPPPVDFSEFYQAHFQRVAVQLYAYLGDHAEAQDLTQEAFCRTLERWDRISGYDDPSAFVRRVAWNLATSRLRRVRTAVRHLARQREEHVPGPNPDRVVLLEALTILPAAQRRAIVLHHLAQLTVAEIADQLGVPEGTVKSWLSRARTALARHLTERQEAGRA
ncbi:SigE family RNA polymerase sigma factor [Micromonospora andamanensis]|uniref:SigE family RNA polymerase sigma factor n=1 Tax=Micromonospora andamanensis TaxID=1287068 RepID=UPI00195263EB|nr:SigE family RNA polymerase sigma factor [Micromonospora andamanensis]GIJ38844.1 RNA polymerase sigma24 factor [Micromonospora andamanensis]